MSEQYRCSECGHFVEIQDDAICDVCHIGKMEHLRYIKGDEGSHWDGCTEVHWDCRIAQLEAENAILTAELSMQKSLVAAREQDLNELHVELAALKSEIVSKDKKVTDYEIELRQLHKYDKTCSTCRYLDENQDCVLGIRCVNYALWQGRIL